MPFELSVFSSLLESIISEFDFESFNLLESAFDSETSSTFELELETLSLSFVFDDDEISKKIIEEVKEEASCFLSNFLNINKFSKFIKFSSIPIAGYLIRRYFYPSDFFADPYFFNFDQINNDYVIDKKLHNFIFQYQNANYVSVPITLTGIYNEILNNNNDNNKTSSASPPMPDQWC